SHCLFQLLVDSSYCALYVLSLSVLPLLSLRHRLSIFFFFLVIPPPPRSTLFPYTTLFRSRGAPGRGAASPAPAAGAGDFSRSPRSEEHTSELQSRVDLVCRLLLEKKKEQKQQKRNT